MTRKRWTGSRNASPCHNKSRETRTEFKLNSPKRLPTKFSDDRIHWFTLNTKRLYLTILYLTYLMSWEKIFYVWNFKPISSEGTRNRFQLRETNNHPDKVLHFFYVSFVVFCFIFVVSKWNDALSIIECYLSALLAINAQASVAYIGAIIFCHAQIHEIINCAVLYFKKSKDKL